MTRRHAFWIAGSVALAALISVSGMAQTAKKEPPWVAKDWREWTQSDCNLVFQDSPWNQIYAPAPAISVFPPFKAPIQILSGLPIRQAIVRLIQIQKHYENMSPEEKQAFDLEYARDLSEDYGGQVAIRALGTFYPDRMGGLKYPAKQAALLLSDGRLVMPVSTTLSATATGSAVGQTRLDIPSFFSPTSSTAVYVFPRTVDGKPIYAEQDKAITVVFGKILPDSGVKQEFGPQKPEDFHRDRALRVDFPIATLMYKGKLEY
jgi:hypothetical protein